MASSTHHVTWDEETIALHDADRGTRMKIDEPKTPYHHHDAHDHERLTQSEGVNEGPALSWDRLHAKLEQVQDEAKERDFKDNEREEEKNVRAAGNYDKERFAEKRKKHYNEFERVQRWRQEHQGEDEEEEQDDENEPKHPKLVV